MPFTITGGKYASASISVVGTTTCTVTTTPFVSGDFGVQRLVGLWSSASVFKGIAYVRRWVSTSQLQLESQFFDPVNGNIITQAAGDLILVSKNLAECATTGLAFSGNTATISDFCTIGTSGSPMSACIYDEYKSIVFTGAGSQTTGIINHAGGIFCTGHLTSWNDKTTYGGVNYTYLLASGGSLVEGVICTSTAAQQFVFGGSRNGTTGTVWEPAHKSNSFHRAGSIVWMDIDSIFGLLGPADGGGDWLPATASRMCFYNNRLVSSGLAISSRTSNGVYSGGSIKLIGAQTLAAFGSTTTQPYTFNFGADADKRLKIYDIRDGVLGGQPTALFDQASSVHNATVNLTNVLSPKRTVIRTGTGVVTFNWFWRNSYTNIIPNSLAIIERVVDRVVAASVFTSGSVADLTIQEQRQSGASIITPPIVFDYSSWRFGLWKYGYEPISTLINRTVINLGGDINSNEVSFGGALAQPISTNITLSESSSIALATIGTLDNLYDRSVAWKCQSVANAQYPTLNNYLITANGTNLEFGSLSLVIDSSAITAFTINTTTNVATIKTNALASGTKFKSITANVTITGDSLTNMTVNGTVTQNIPTNLSNINTTNLTYNTAVDTSITLTNCIISTIKNDGVGVITILKAGTTAITDYSDTQINFLDSTLSFLGITSLTAYPTASDRDNNTNIGFTATTSPFNFKFGSVVSGITLSGVVYLRITVGGSVQLTQVTIALGDNVVNLSDNSLLQGLQTNLQKVNRNVIKTSKFKTANETF